MIPLAEESESAARVVLLVDPEAVPAWAERMHRRLPAAVMAGPAVDVDTLSRMLDTVTAVAIDGNAEGPLSNARRIRRVVPQIQVVLVATGGRRAELERRILFTPGLGEPWIVGPEEADVELLDRATTVGRQRREHARRSTHVSRRVARLEPDQERRRFLSDRYLATLLELLPEPVMALDENDRILFANPVAIEVFDVSRGGETGTILSLLDPDDPGLLQDLLARGREEPTSAQVTLHPEEGEGRTYDVSVAPVRGDRPVRALVLHDVTDQVRTRRTLERQAKRLEAQAEERERLLEERDEALEELREAMRQRTRFYANMSHELRTPLNAIVGYNDLLLNEIYGEVPDEHRTILDRIRSASQHLRELIDDVLDLSKLEAGTPTVEPSEVDVSHLLQDLNATVEPLARSHDVDLRFHVDESCAGRFRTDPRRLRQILINLISNAVQYGAGEPVDVRCRRDDERLSIGIQDRGPGIPADKHDEIFEEFVQLERAEGTGTGLGLSIARALARSLQGEVTVRSEPGTGSVFTLSVPDLGRDQSPGGTQ